MLERASRKTSRMKTKGGKELLKCKREKTVKKMQQVRTFFNEERQITGRLIANVPCITGDKW